MSVCINIYIIYMYIFIYMRVFKGACDVHVCVREVASENIMMHASTTVRLSVFAKRKVNFMFYSIDDDIVQNFLIR